MQQLAKTKRQEALGIKKNLISSITTLLDSNGYFSTKIKRHMKKQESMAHSKGKNQQKLSEKRPDGGSTRQRL